MFEIEQLNFSPPKSCFAKVFMNFLVAPIVLQCFSLAGALFHALEASFLKHINERFEALDSTILFVCIDRVPYFH